MAQLVAQFAPRYNDLVDIFQEIMRMVISPISRLQAQKSNQ